MAKKSKVSCFSVKKSDPATRSGMIDVLQSLAPHCPVDLKGWHPPLIAPSFHVQNTMVAGDYGFWEMGKETYQHIAFSNLHSCFVNLNLSLSCLYLKQISGQKVTYNRSGEKDSTARLAGLVPVLQAWHKKKVFYFCDVWEILSYVFLPGRS